MKIINCTIIDEILTEEGHKKLEERENETIFEDLVCENGRTAEDYDTLGMKLPKDLVEKQKNFGKDQDLPDEFFDIVYKPGLFRQAGPLQTSRLQVMC